MPYHSPFRHQDNCQSSLEKSKKRTNRKENNFNLKNTAPSEKAIAPLRKKHVKGISRESQSQIDSHPHHRNHIAKHYICSRSTDLESKPPTNKHRLRNCGDPYLPKMAPHWNCATSSIHPHGHHMHGRANNSLCPAQRRHIPHLHDAKRPHDLSGATCAILFSNRHNSRHHSPDRKERLHQSAAHNRERLHTCVCHSEQFRRAAI